MEMKQIERDLYRVSRAPDDVVEVEWAAGIEISGDLARSVTADMVEVSEGSQLAVCVYMGGTRGLDRDARMHFQTFDGASAVALIVSSSVSRVIANFFTGLSKPAIPIRVFDSNDTARTWLRTLARP
jgi:hypothetical protein